MAYYVCKGAKLKCSMGDSESELAVIPGNGEFSGGKEMANIMDFQPLVNIMPFGQCQSLANPMVAAATAANFGKLQPMPCIPAIVDPWKPGKIDFPVRGQPALMNDCKLLCMWAGEIEIIDDKQKNKNRTTKVSSDGQNDTDITTEVSDDEQNDTDITTGSDPIPTEEIEKKPKCVVHFRPFRLWKGEYGFDWIREKDEGVLIFPNWLSGNNYDSTEVLGKHTNDECTEKEEKKDCPWRNQCFSISRTSKICCYINWFGTKFQSDKYAPSNGSMYKNLQKYFENLYIQGQEYRVPVLTIMPDDEITINMRIEIKDNALKKPLYWSLWGYDYNEDVNDFLEYDNSLMEPDLSVINTKQEIDFTLRCFKTFREDKYLSVYTDNPRENKDARLCGKLRILANDPSHHRILKIVFIRVITDIGNGPRDGTIIELDEKKIMENIFKQGYVFIEKHVGDYPKVTLDLSTGAKQKAFIESCVDPNSKKPHTVKKPGLLNYLNKELKEQFGNYYENYIKVYSIKEICPGIGGFAENESESAVFFMKSKGDTIAHELLHVIGLAHTFNAPEAAGSYKAPLTYKAQITDNIMDYSNLKLIMDYSDLKFIKKISTFYWQWEIMNTKISKKLYK